MAAKDDLGRRGEALAVQHLMDSDYAILDRNWRCSQGEIDIVARIGNTTVFVEVKTRTSVAFGDPMAAVTRQKLARLWRLAWAWCAAHPASRGEVRIDAIGIVAPTHGLVQIDHITGISY